MSRVRVVQPVIDIDGSPDKDVNIKIQWKAYN